MPRRHESSHHGLDREHGRAYRFDAMPDPVTVVKDRRTTDVGRNKAAAAGAEIVCPECGATMKTVKASFADKDAGIRHGAQIIPNHRQGGGTYSARRGDTLCKAALTPAELL